MVANRLRHKEAQEEVAKEQSLSGDQIDSITQETVEVGWAAWYG